MRVKNIIPLLAVVFLSCNADQSSKIIELENKVTTLERKVQDLQEKIDQDIYQSIKSGGKKSKKKQPKEDLSVTPQPQSYSTSNYSNTKTTETSYSGQCMATTKKGRRCSRSARSNGYCWQHGG